MFPEPPLILTWLLVLTFVGERPVSLALHADLADQVDLLTQKLIFLDRKFGVLLLQFEKFLWIPIAEKGEAHHDKSARSHVRDFFRHVDVSSRG